MLRAISIIPQNSPKRKPVPPARFLQLHSGRQREARCCALCFLSFLSNGLEMYYYANVNFDTEFKKRLLDFFFPKKKRSHMWSSLLSLFCNVNCNYAFCKRGEGRKGKEVALHLCSMVSVSMVSPRPGGDGEWEVSPVRNPWRGRDLGVLPWSLAGLMAQQILEGLQFLSTNIWYRILHPTRTVLTRCSSGAPKASVFSGKQGLILSWIQNPFKLRKPCLTSCEPSS